MFPYLLEPNLDLTYTRSPRILEPGSSPFTVFQDSHAIYAAS